MLFLIMWGGSFVVTINTKLLGGHISFFQCVCVLGYCVFPIVLIAACIYALKVFGLNFFLLKVGLGVFAIIWSTLSNILTLFRLTFLYECYDWGGQKGYCHLSHFYLLSIYWMVCSLYLITIFSIIIYCLLRSVPRKSNQSYNIKYNWTDWKNKVNLSD